MAYPADPPLRPALPAHCLSQLTPSGATPISNEQLFEFLVHVIGLDVEPVLGGIQPTTDMERADLQVAFIR